MSLDNESGSDWDSMSEAPPPPRNGYKGAVTYYPPPQGAATHYPPPSSDNNHSKPSSGYRHKANMLAQEAALRRKLDTQPADKNMEPTTAKLENLRSVGLGKLCSFLTSTCPLN